MATITSEIVRGDRFDRPILLTSVLDGVSSPYDTVANSVTPVMQLRDGPGSTDILIVVMAIAVSGTSNDRLDLSLPASTTLTLEAGSVLYARLMMQHTTNSDLDQITPTDWVFTVRDSATQR